MVMRRTATPAIPPSLYRHFAVLTVVLAAGLAIFAEDENREAQAAHFVSAQAAGRAAAPAIARAAPAPTAGNSADGWDEVEFDSGFGAPMDAPSDASGPGSDLGENSAPPADSPATLSTMEREVLLRGLRDQATLQPAG